MKKLISVVVPCYNEEAVLGKFYDAVTKVAAEMSAKEKVEFEFLFVDDGSADGTLNELEKLAKMDARVRFVSFARNFGKEAALLAGLEYAKGDFVATMDADLQDPPALLPEMYDFVKDGEYDCAATRRVNRDGEPPIRSFFARIFYKLINRMSKIEMVDGARDYRLMARKMVNAIISMREYNRYSKGLFSFVGFRTKWVEFKHVDRAAGETKWSFWKLFVYAIEGICAFSTMPLAVAAGLGVVICCVAGMLAMIIVAKTLMFGDPVSGWPSLICVVLMMGGLQMLALGVIGQYLAKTYLETKQRPIYIVRTTDEDLREKDSQDEELVL